MNEIVFEIVRSAACAISGILCALLLVNAGMTAFIRKNRNRHRPLFPRKGRRKKK